MKESRYMASTELNQLMWLSAAVQALEKILKTKVVCAGSAWPKPTRTRLLMTA